MSTENAYLKYCTHVTRRGGGANLGLDVLTLDSRPAHEASHVDLVIEVTDVTHNGVVLHLGHVGGHDDVLVTGGGHEDVHFANHVLHRGHLRQGVGHGLIFN